MYLIKYHRPKLTSTLKHKVKSKYLERTMTIFLEDKLKDTTYMIPVRANIHPKGLREVAKLDANQSCKVSAIAITLITLLHSEEQRNTVQVTYEDLAKLSGISLRTIVRAMSALEEAGFIARLGKTSYKLSPALCWYGNQVDWAIALRQLEDNKHLSKKEQARLPHTTILDMLKNENIFSEENEVDTNTSHNELKENKDDK